MRSIRGTFLLRITQEPHSAGVQFVDRPTSLTLPPCGPCLPACRAAGASTSARWPPPRSSCLRRQLRADVPQPGRMLSSNGDACALTRALQAGHECSLHRAATFVTEHDEHGVCKCTAAYCSVPMTSGEITLPATRTINSSPKPASNTVRGARETLQRGRVGADPWRARGPLFARSGIAPARERSVRCPRSSRASASSAV